MSKRELLLRWEGSAAAVVLDVVGDETLRDQSELSAVFPVPYDRDVVPLSVGYGRVFFERQMDVLQVGEEGYLDTALVRLDHGPAVGWHVRRAEEKLIRRLRDTQIALRVPNVVKSEENLLVVVVLPQRELHPHCDRQALRRASEEWNDLRCAAAPWVAKVQVVVHLDRWKRNSKV